MRSQQTFNAAALLLSSLASATYTEHFITGSSNQTIQVLSEGSGPSLLINPSYARDSIADFNALSTGLATAGFRVLRPQPRGMAQSAGPIDATRAEIGADLAAVITQLGDGKAVVLGHAYGHTKTRIMALDYPELVPAMVLASINTGVGTNATIAATAAVVSNYSYPVDVRLAALELGYFAEGQNASVWLDGWFVDAISATMGSETALGTNETQILDLIPMEDPWRKEDQWDYILNLAPGRTTQGFVANASHALFPENLQGVLDVLVPWLEEQTSSW